MRNVITIIPGVLDLVPTKTEGALIVVPVPEDSDVFTAMKAVGHPRLKHRSLVIPTAALREFMVTGKRIVADDVAIEAFNGRDGEVFRFTFQIGKLEFPKTIGAKKVEDALIEAEALTVSASIHRALVDLFRAPGGVVSFGKKVDDALVVLDSAVRDEVGILQEKLRTEKSGRKPAGERQPRDRQDDRPRISVRDLASRFGLSEDELMPILHQANAQPNRDGLVLEAVVPRVEAKVKELRSGNAPTPPAETGSKAPAGAEGAGSSGASASAAASADKPATETEERVKLRDLAARHGLNMGEMTKALKACAVTPKPSDMSVTAKDAARIEGKILKDLEARTAPKAAPAPAPAPAEAQARVTGDGQLVLSPFAGLKNLAGATE